VVAGGAAVGAVDGPLSLGAAAEDMAAHKRGGTARVRNEQRNQRPRCDTLRPGAVGARGEERWAAYMG
jgi:hypothetical protein